MPTPKAVTDEETPEQLRKRAHAREWDAIEAVTDAGKLPRNMDRACDCGTEGKNHLPGCSDARAVGRVHQTTARMVGKQLLAVATTKEQKAIALYWTGVTMDDLAKHGLTLEEYFKFNEGNFKH